MTWRDRLAPLIVGALLVSGCQSRSTSHRSLKASQELSHRPSSPQGRALRQLCADVGTAPCAVACPPTLPSREHAECLIDFRFGDDTEALELAHALYAKTGVLPGVDNTNRQSAYSGEPVLTRPALPVGDDRQHLAWLIASFDRYDEVFAALAERAPAPIDFRLRPDAFGFFRTEKKTFPSAWGQGGVVGYNLEGPLHTTERDVLETLFHELFHLNDERRGGWSASALGELFESIISRCGGEHACLESFAPGETCVPDGTFYPFDERTRDVREYGAELALRYYLEHEAILRGAPLEPPFKCGSQENLAAWERLARDFFGGLDLSRDCAAPPAREGS